MKKALSIQHSALGPSTVVAKAEAFRAKYLPLPRSFFARDPQVVARELLGKTLVRQSHGLLLRGRIVEAEVYLGERDPAAHAAAGRTARNAVLFGPAGHAYVYFIYGMYFCLNFSCLQEGQAGSVLIRALEPLEGLEHMAEARHLPPGKAETAQGRRLLTSGPGRLCQAFGIVRERDNGKDVTSATSDLYVADDGFRPGHLREGPRVGISKAAGLPLRFFLAGNPFVSGKKP